MPDTTRQMIAELRELLRLTQTEIQIAETRRAQARTDAVERELARNAENGRRRARDIARTLRDLGGVPDVVTTVVGRLGATAKAGIEQAQPLTEALFGDLALEHQLQDRAKYLKGLATAAGNTRVVRLAERLDEAHGATIEWLTVVLAETAIGGPAALRPTPVQAVVGMGLGVASLPVRTVTRSLNTVVDRAVRLRAKAQETAEEAAATASEMRDAVVDVVSTGRDASLRQAEVRARREGADDTADAIHETRRDLGALDGDELPIRQYDTLTVARAVAAVQKLDRAEDVRAVIAYEEAHKNRGGVVSAAQVRIAELAREVLAD